MRIEKPAMIFAAVTLSVSAALAQPNPSTPAPLPNERRDCPPDVANPVSPRNNETTGSANLSQEGSPGAAAFVTKQGRDLSACWR